MYRIQAGSKLLTLCKFLDYLEFLRSLFKESEYADNSYYCLIAVRSADAENPVYQRIVEAYQCDEVIDVYNGQFAGFFTPTWKLEG